MCAREGECACGWWSRNSTNTNTIHITKTNTIHNTHTIHITYNDDTITTTNLSVPPLLLSFKLSGYANPSTNQGCILS